MALIEYRIMVDQNGQATVLQDVREIGPGDRIQFVSNVAGTFIQFQDASPFKEAGAGDPIAVPQPTADPKAKMPDLATTIGGQQKQISQPMDVTVNNAGYEPLPLQFVAKFQESRRAFRFQCGRVNGGVFTPWGGPGSRSPDGGSNF